MSATPVFIDSFVDATNQKVMLPGRKNPTWFEFSWRFGPVLVDMHGEPLSKQPICEDHPFWPPFNAWLKEYERKHPNPYGRAANTQALASGKAEVAPVIDGEGSRETNKSLSPRLARSE